MTERPEAEHSVAARGLDQLEASHRFGVQRVKGSVSHRFDSLIVGSRTPQRWRNAPRIVWSIAKESWRRRASARSLPSTGTIDARSPIAAASILDEFSHACLAPELDLQPVTRRWRRTANDADLLVAETAWRGNRGVWKYEFSHFRSGSDLERLVAFSRERGLPTVLWNKEDPSHFETFLEVAKIFDVVLTTDSNCVPRYRRALGHSRVAPCMFAAQPAIHNPIGRITGPASSVCFAGAWRGDVHPGRGAALERLLDSAMAAGELRIFDREPTADKQGFPDRFRANIVGTVPYEQMLREYRQHACFVNVNTVVDSPTMMSRRVYELLACRTPVVSTPSLAIDEQFADIVLTPSDTRQTIEELQQLIHDPDHRDRIGQVGYRTVMREHTYQERVSTMMQVAGIDGFPEYEFPSVVAVCQITDLDQLDQLAASVSRQSLAPTHTIVILRDDQTGSRPAGSDPVWSERDGTAFLSVQAGTPTNVELRMIRDRFAGELFAFLDGRDQYGPNFLLDSTLASRFAEAGVYGKRTTHTTGSDGESVDGVDPGHEFEYTESVLPGTALIRRGVIDMLTRQRTARPGLAIENAAIAAANTSNLRIFSTDRFNHVLGQRPVNPTSSRSVPSPLRGHATQLVHI